MLFRRNVRGNEFDRALWKEGLGRHYYERKTVNLARRKALEHTRNQIRNKI